MNKDRFQSHIELEIFDIMGRRVFKTEVENGTFTFNPTLQPGMYFLRLSDQFGKVLGTGKFVRQ